MGRGKSQTLEATLVGSQVSDTGCTGGSRGRKNSNLVKPRALSSGRREKPLCVGGGGEVLRAGVKGKGQRLLPRTAG